MNNSSKKLKKIGFYGYLDSQIEETILILRNYFSIEICEDLNKCDYLFIGPFKDIFECPFSNNQIRIYYTGEPSTPPFSLVDYAIGFEKMSYKGIDNKERYLYNNFCLRELYKYRHYECWNGIKEEKARQMLKMKNKFCSFLYSHASPNGIREELFKAICTYKKVDSIGTFQNNMKDGKIVDRNSYNQKIELLNNYKFNIACESVIKAGYCSEKIGHSFAGNSIPIYFGDPFVVTIFNPKSFINGNDFETLDQLINYVKYVDENDDVYVKMLSEPKLLNKNAIFKAEEEYRHFLYYILNQDKEKAFRRCNYYSDLAFEKKLITTNQLTKKIDKIFSNRLLHFLIKIHHIFRKKEA